MPIVLIVEALAQTGRVALLTLSELKGKIAYFCGIKKAKFRKMVCPGDILQLEVYLDKLRVNSGIGKARATIDGTVACTVGLIFYIQ